MATPGPAFDPDYRAPSTQLGASMSKKGLSEQDICTKFIIPAATIAGWDDHTQIRQEGYFTKGCIIVRGLLVTRGKAKRADYVLYYKPNLPIAIIEAKDKNREAGAGMQQALEYAEALDIPFVFTSNGDSFVFHDRAGQSPQAETEIALSAFSSPALLLERVGDEAGKDPDPFDPLCHVAFDRPPFTRPERVENVPKRYVFTNYSQRAHVVLETLLRNYQDEAVTSLDDPRILRLAPLKSIGMPVQRLREFGGLDGFTQSVHELQTAIYAEVA